MAQQPTNQQDEKKNLILGDDFEMALCSAAEVKNRKLSLCKERNKNNYIQFYDLMLGSRVDIQEAMARKGRAKTQEDRDAVKGFRKSTSQIYRQICDILAPEEDLQEGDLTKVQKMVQKVSKVVKMLRYIGNTEMEDEFGKEGITLGFKTLEEESELFSQEHIKKEISDIFANGKSIREDINRNNEEIKTNIYESSVPIDLQYDKSTNPTGIKSSDFCKIVDIKARMLQAQDDEVKDKVKETAETMAGDYVFQNARNNLINSKLLEISA